MVTVHVNDLRHPTNAMKTDTSQLGKAKELHAASILVAYGIYVFRPLVDKGFDLIATNKSGTAFIPVQVRFDTKRSGFLLEGHELKKFKEANAVIAFCSLSATPGDGMSTSETVFWFVPIAQFVLVSRQREDGKHVVPWNEHLELSATWKGKEGLEAAFQSVLPADNS